MSLLVMLPKVEDRVEYILEHWPESRNSDILLQWIYVSKFEGVQLPPLPQALMEKPSIMGTISRSRRKIQNTLKKLRPTRKEVAIKRGWAEEDLRKYYGSDS